MTMSRREFVKGGLSAAALIGGVIPAFAGEAVRNPFPPWAKGHYQVHFIYTGAGESMFHIFPDGTTMLLDCGDFDALSRGKLAVPVLPSPIRRAGERIARYVRRVNPQDDRVDYMLTTHYHRDHTGVLDDGWTPSGWQLASKQLHFGKAFDRAYPEYRDPVPLENDGHRVRELMECVYSELGKRDGLKVEKFRLGAEDQIVPLRDPTAAVGFKVRNICVNGRIAMPDGTIVSPLIKNGMFASYYDENHMSCGCVFRYGKFRFFSAGDFSGLARFADGTEVWPEKLIGKAVGHVQVAKINHHGHHSMPAECLANLRARVYVACVWDQLHVTDDTLTRISDRSTYPGDRLIAPGIMSIERRQTEANRPWMKDVAPETYDGAHVVLDVPPGGETYSLFFLTASDESMQIKGVRTFLS